LILDERSVEEDIYATAKPAASKKSKERKTA